MLDWHWCRPTNRLHCVLCLPDKGHHTRFRLWAGRVPLGWLYRWGTKSKVAGRAFGNLGSHRYSERWVLLLVRHRWLRWFGRFFQNRNGWFWVAWERLDRLQSLCLCGFGAPWAGKVVERWGVPLLCKLHSHIVRALTRWWDDRMPKWQGSLLLPGSRLLDDLRQQYARCHAPRRAFRQWYRLS